MGPSLMLDGTELLFTRLSFLAKIKYFEFICDVYVQFYNKYIIISHTKMVDYVLKFVKVFIQTVTIFNKYIDYHLKIGGSSSEYRNFKIFGGYISLVETLVV